MHIVLLEPEIPQNTGNIGRTCVATGATLHLIKPLGFHTDDKTLRRAGLDYWPHLKVFYYDNFSHFIEAASRPVIYMATTKAQKRYTDVTYDENSYIMFGKESAGIPEEILLEFRESCIRIPMLKEHRSLNISISVAVILYEALRQNNFPSLEAEGQLHNLCW